MHKIFQYDKIYLLSSKEVEDIKSLDDKKRLNIIHVDMDAFYASVEEQDNPKLKGLPVIVGGLNNHGVVTTANYEARKYGVHSAMPIFIAKKKCPHGCYVPGRMKRYQEVSMEVVNILYEFTDLIERVSIDESYLDITHINMEPLLLVNEIKKRVLKETGLTMSVGISYNKFLAKLASDWNKPAGITEISKDMIPEILMPLSIKKVHGLGPKSAKRLNDIGIYTIGDLLEISEDFLIELLGKLGKEVYHRIRGIDNRPVNTVRKRKSLGIERTFKKDTKDKNLLKEYVKTFSMELEAELKAKKIHGRTITLKIKDENFKTQTRSRTLMSHIDSFDEIFEVGNSLLNEFDIKDKIRLLGLSASNLISSDLKQLSFFDND